MSVENDSKHGASTAQLEVDELKELVKMLERQNETLRKRSVKLSPHPKQSGDGISLLVKPNFNPIKPLHTDDVFKNDCLSDDEINEQINNIALLEKESPNWFFPSPTKLIPDENSSTPMTPEKWMSSELENPSTPQLKAAKTEILSQLNPPYARPIFKNFTAPIEVITTGNYTAYDEIKKQRQESVQSPLLDFEDDLNLNENIDLPHERFENEKIPQSPTQYVSSTHSNRSPTPTHHAAHHMPLPSHTRTTQHGLSPSRPSSTGRYRSPSPKINPNNSRRSASFDRSENQTNRRSESPKIINRSMTPGGLRKPGRQSLPATPRGRTASPRPNINYGAKKDVSNKSNLMRFKPNVQSTSEIKSKLGTPRATRPTSKLAAPSAAAGKYDLIKYNENNNSGSRSNTPRRSLPRPSQTNSKNQFARKKLAGDPGGSGIMSPKLNSTGTNSPRGSDAGSDITWSEGEFF